MCEILSLARKNLTRVSLSRLLMVKEKKMGVGGRSRVTWQTQMKEDFMRGGFSELEEAWDQARDKREWRGWMDALCARRHEVPK
ncbi:hypothetical protein CEXT_572911 [Caerostris extrusa]|uniref:Uncharacterized protein n=1 Tax=Caerostris extrusa TaxID=172846 RepID=A0AAV4TE72_CAEEX|nr:hypothetical protein CEXT_572911 [Caerostris extrusa]